MKVFSFFCQAAVPGPDGTITFVRSGITRFADPKPGQHHQAALVVGVCYDPSEQGQHEMDIVGVNADGKRVWQHRNPFDLPKAGGNHMYLTAFQTVLGVGLYELHVYVDSKLVDTLPFEVAPAQPATTGLPE